MWLLVSVINEIASGKFINVAVQYYEFIQRAVQVTIDGHKY